MIKKSGFLKAIALAAASTLTLGASAQDKPIKPGGNWGGMITETDGGHLFGNPKATTRLVEFMSYTCSHCAQFAQTSDGVIKLLYVSTGKVSFEVRHLVRDPVDLSAAMLTHCGDPSKFGGNHDAIMSRYDEWVGKARNATQAQQSRWQFGSLSARLQAIASDLDFYDIMETRGFTRAQLDRCLSDEAKAKEIAETSRADVEKYGLKGTPSFVLNGELLEGTHDWDSLQTHLDETI